MAILVLAACTPAQTTDATSTQESTNTVQSNANIKEVETNSVQESWGNILKLGGKFKCIATTEGGQATMYVDNGNYRTELMTSQGKAFAITKMQSDNSFCSFVWTDQSTEVIKTCMSKEQLDSYKEKGQGSNSQSVNNDQFSPQKKASIQSQ